MPLGNMENRNGEWTYQPTPSRGSRVGLEHQDINMVFPQVEPQNILQTFPKLSVLHSLPHFRPRVLRLQVAARLDL